MLDVIERCCRKCQLVCLISILLFYKHRYVDNYKRKFAEQVEV